MRPPMIAWLGLFPLLLSATSSADDRVDQEKPAVKTAKERLVSKAADPQRMDDCKVPQERRDPDRPRPDCSDAMETEATDTQGSN